MNTQNDVRAHRNELGVTDLPCAGSVAEALTPPSGIAMPRAERPRLAPLDLRPLQPRAVRVQPPPTVSSTSLPLVSVTPEACVSAMPGDARLAALRGDPLGLGDAVVPGPRRWGALAGLSLGAFVCLVAPLSGLALRRANATPASAAHAIAAPSPAAEATIAAPQPPEAPQAPAPFARMNRCTSEPAASAAPRTTRATPVRPRATKQVAAAAPLPAPPPPPRAAHRLFDTQD